MDKKKIGAGVGVVALTLIIVFTQLFDFSIFSLNNEKNLVQKALLENALAEGLSDEVKEKKTITYKQEEKVEYVVASPIRSDALEQSSEEQKEIDFSVAEKKEDKKEESEKLAVEEKVEKIFSGYIQTEARLREKANTECEILDVLEVNTFVRGVVEGEWLKITHDNVTGYVRLDLVGLSEVQGSSDEESEQDNQGDVNDTEHESEKTDSETYNEPNIKPEPEAKPESEIEVDESGSNQHSENGPDIQEQNNKDDEKDDNSGNSDEESNENQNNSGNSGEESDKPNSESSAPGVNESSNGNVKPEEENKPKPEDENNPKPEDESNQNSEKPEEDNSGYPIGAGSSDEYSIDEFKYAGLISWNGKTFSFYSQNVLPGEGLDIPGRHCEGGYVRDGDGYIVLANDYYPKGTIISTPFGSDGKVYDAFGYGKPPYRFDVYIEYFDAD